MPSARETTERPARGGDGEVRTLAKGLDILMLFSPERHTLTVDEVARELGFAKSSTYRLITTLKDRGFVRRVPGGDGYTLDTGVLRFGEVVRAASPLYGVARPFMEEVVAASKESSGLVVRTGDSGTIAARVDSPEMMRFMPEVGWSFPLHVGAAGKVLLAHAPPADIERYLARRLGRTAERVPGDAEALAEELAQTRAQGFSLVEQGAAEGILAVASPVFGADGEVVGSLTMVGPIFRFTRERALEHVPVLKDCARRLSDALGAPS